MLQTLLQDREKNKGDTIAIAVDEKNTLTQDSGRNKVGAITIKGKKIKIIKYAELADKTRENIKKALAERQIPITVERGDLWLPKKHIGADGHTEKMAKILGKLINTERSVNTPCAKHDADRSSSRSSKKRKNKAPALEKLDFEEIQTKVQAFANFLENKQEEIAEALSNYECYNVVIDEINRSTELLRNLDKNKEYFQRRIGQVTAFLPLNQPLYATVSFGVIASLMSSKTYARPPAAMTETFKKLDTIINFSSYFTNLYISYKSRDDFVRLSQASDVVIFTGKPENALEIRDKIKKALKTKEIINKEPLFILNGAGHNPVVIAEGADLAKAVKSVIRVCLQNQGQDCAAPNAILMQENNLEEFKAILLEELKHVKVGPYKNRENAVGPNTDPAHAAKIKDFINNNIEDCIYNDPCNFSQGIICPTVFLRPLTQEPESPNLTEFFAPIIMVQPYEKDDDLQFYFEHPKYKENAMYVSLFGNSNYVEGLVEKGLHPKENILRNTDLHKAEKGYLPYGGLGPGASCVYKNDKIIPGATLVSREIFEHIVKPAIEEELANSKSVTESSEISATNLELEYAHNNVQEAQQSDDRFRRRSASLGRALEIPPALNSVDSGLNTPAETTICLEALTINGNASVEDEGLAAETEVSNNARGNEEQSKSSHFKGNQKALPKRKTSEPYPQFKSENNSSYCSRPSFLLSGSSVEASIQGNRSFPR